MKRSIPSARKSRRGRPRIDAVAVNVRIPPPLLSALDKFISAKDEAPSRPEAIREIIEAVLIPAKKPRFDA